MPAEEAVTLSDPEISYSTYNNRDSQGNNDDNGGQEEDSLLRRNKRSTSSGFLSSSFSWMRLTGDDGASIRSVRRHKMNYILAALWIVTALGLLSAGGYVLYRTVLLPRYNAMQFNDKIKAHAKAAKERVAFCMTKNYTWEEACDALGGNAGARRNLEGFESIMSTTASSSELQDQRHRHLYAGTGAELEQLLSDDPSVTFDESCLRMYRLRLRDGITFPYYSGQLLLEGGKQSMVLFIQHGALRNPEAYFCSFKSLMLRQGYRNFDDVLIVAPNFSYERDLYVHPNDAYWNTTKPWGDWRVGAQSDPGCCGNSGRDYQVTISSFEVLDNFLAILTDKDLFPNMHKISFVGHSAGAQMVQRYAMMSSLVALWDFDPDLDVEFIVANPSSYTYLTPERYEYSCGHCECNRHNCTCDQDCHPNPPYKKLGRPRHKNADKEFPCYQWNWDRWPYGLGSFRDKKRGRYIPYAFRDGELGVMRAKRLYSSLHMVYMVGQNDTCNDGLATCDKSCWKRNEWDEAEGETQCYRNHMDSRCPAMLQGPNRNVRAHQYMRYLERLYGKPTHKLHEIKGVGHDAAAMFGSDIGMEEIFGYD